MERLATLTEIIAGAGAVLKDACANGMDQLKAQRKQSDKQAQLDEIKTRIRDKIAAMKTLATDAESSTAVSSQQQSFFHQSVDSKVQQATDVQALLKLEGRITGQYYATDAEMIALEENERALEPFYQSILLEWSTILNDALSQATAANIQPIFEAKRALYAMLTPDSLASVVAADKAAVIKKNAALTQAATDLIPQASFNHASFCNVFTSKDIIATWLHQLEAPGHTFENSCFNALQTQLSAIATYASERYRDQRNYTNWFRLGASRQTKLEGALAIYDLMVLNVKGDPLSRQGIRGVTGGRLGAIVSGVMQRIVHFYRTFLETVAESLKSTPKASSTDVVSSGSSFSDYCKGFMGLKDSSSLSTTSDGPSTPLSSLSSPQASSTATTGYMQFFTRNPVSSPLKSLQAAVQARQTFLTTLERAFNERVGGDRPEAIGREYDGFKSSYNDFSKVIVEIKPGVFADPMPSYMEQMAEVDTFNFCLLKFSEMLEATGNAWCADPSKKNDVLWGCQKQISIYEERLKTPNFSAHNNTVVLRAMNDLKQFVEKQYEDKGKIKLAIKCLKLLATHGSIAINSSTSEEMSLMKTEVRDSLGSILGDLLSSKEPSRVLSRAG